jgi:hypothetical protein
MDLFATVKSVEIPGFILTILETESKTRFDEFRFTTPRREGCGFWLEAAALAKESDAIEVHEQKAMR